MFSNHQYSVVGFLLPKNNEEGRSVMFDIEKARNKGMDERTIKILQDINDNNQKEESCQRHEFEHEKINGLPKYRCKNCDCVVDVAFVKGYWRGLEHGKQ
ncbi:hypothetical protein LI325_12815 [Enterocloster lavalensis]|nr:hypothetical protein [Enterocloster lavalensis]